MTDLCDRIIRVVSKDTGLDAIAVSRRSDTEWAVFGVQIKLGEVGNTITRGVLDTQRRNIETNKFVNDMTIAGIIAKAERGMANALALLRAAFPHVIMSPARIVLLTNKVVTADGIQLAETENVMAAHALSLDLCHSHEFYDCLPRTLRESLVPH